MTLADAVRTLFAPQGKPSRVGAEVEMIPVTDEVRPRTVDPGVLVAGFDSGFLNDARPTFEPGGQLELSPPPSLNAAQLTANLHQLIERARLLASTRGVRLETLGTNPWHSCQEVPLRTATPRYLALQKLLDAGGPSGRRMMRLTASLQLNVDLLPGQAGRDQWLVSNLAGPALTATFANSSRVDGRSTDLVGARTAIWLGIDMGRTGYDGRHLDLRDPIGAYTSFAAAAERLPMPEVSNPMYHLSTLFPPVRPRGGYLELRYLDTQPVERLGQVISIIIALLYDNQARLEALELLRSEACEMERAWQLAASGISRPAADLLSIANDAALRLGHPPLSVGSTS